MITAANFIFEVYLLSIQIIFMRKLVQLNRLLLLSYTSHDHEMYYDLRRVLCLSVPTRFFLVQIKRLNNQ